MPLPTSPDMILAPGDTIPSQLLNALQNAIVGLYRRHTHDIVRQVAPVSSPVQFADRWQFARSGVAISTKATEGTENSAMYIHVGLREGDVVKRWGFFAQDGEEATIRARAFYGGADLGGVVDTDGSGESKIYLSTAFTMPVGPGGGYSIRVEFTPTGSQVRSRAIYQVYVDVMRP